MSSPAGTEILTRAAVAAAMPPDCRHGEAREAVWRQLAARGLVWQPGDGPEGAGQRPLVLSSAQEWTAEHLKDVALHVLRVEAGLREFGWTLGSAASHWVQFAGCRPVWISQTAMRPQGPGPWEARQQFERELLLPLLERCDERLGRCCRRARLHRMWERVARLADTEPRDEVALWQKRIERLAPRRRWSPWKTAELLKEPAGLVSILVKEAATRLGARLVYELRGKHPMCAALRPDGGPAWVRFHECEEEAAADYLEQRAAHGGVLPLWNRTGDPMKACPQRAEADLAVAVGRGNIPPALPELAQFADQLSRMARAAMVEFVPVDGGVEWDAFLGVIRGRFRVAGVVETGAGRRLCTLERS